MTISHASPDTVVRALYSSLSFLPGQAPDLDGLKELFHPAGRFTLSTAHEWESFGVNDFIDAYQRVLGSRFLTAFVEKEIWRDTHVFGFVAQVFSAYEARRSTEDPAPYACGINSMQLVCGDGRWRILSLVWDEKNPGHPDIYRRISRT